MIYTNLDTVMLGFMTNSAQVGYYNAAVKMKNILVSVVSALGAVLLPRVSFYVEKGMHREYKKTLEKTFKVVLLIALPLMTYCMLEAKDVLLFLSGKQYLPALSAMVVIMPTILLIGMSNITGNFSSTRIGKIYNYFYYCWSNFGFAFKHCTYS